LALLGHNLAQQLVNAWISLQSGQALFSFRQDNLTDCDLTQSLAGTGSIGLHKMADFQANSKPK
jgi:hypothetical protein